MSKTPFLIALLLIAPTYAVTMTTASGAAAEGQFSQLEPPPLCSVPHTGPCVAQPHPDFGNVDVPIGIDMPTMTRDSTSTGSADPTGYVTFTITTPAAKAGYVARPPGWANSPVGIVMMPIQGYSEIGADQIYMVPDSSCDGRWTCTYTTRDTSLQAGWYLAMNASGELAGQEICPPNSPNFVYGCGWTSSQSAFYVPHAGDLADPLVRSAVASSGHTTKAVAKARDPEGHAMTLTWDWGDGTITEGALGTVATHTYTDVADFTVTARVRTDDGRNAAWSQSAGILPPAPVLQSVSRVGATSTGVATGLLQAWPEGTKTLVYGWSNGCPSNPATSLDSADQFYPGFSWVTVHGDGTFSRPLTNVPLAPAGYVVLAQNYVDVDGQTYLVKGLSNCVSTVGTVATTTGATAAGEDEVPVDSASVPVGHVAVIDAGTDDAEQRLVIGHGSLILQSGLTKAHSAGAQVVDAGPPVAPYVDPPTPADPAPPSLPKGDGSTVGPTHPGGPGGPGDATKRAPGAPTVTKTRLKGGKLQVSFRPGSDGGSAVTSYLASCTAKGGKTRTAAGTATKLSVGKLTKGKKYTCRVQAVNAIGSSPWSPPGKKVRIPDGRNRSRRPEGS